MRLFSILAAFTLAGLVQAWPDPPCRRPPLAVNYTVEQYAGRWFEIGKIQTPGGAFFERGCQCTHLDVTPVTGDPSTTFVLNTCNRDSPTGKLVVFNETLHTNNNPPNGRYNATIIPGVVNNAYNIILLKTDEYSVEYDCVEQLGVTNYCVHILSRKTTLDESIVNNILKLAEAFDLNPAKLDYVQTKHANCTYP